MSVERSTPSKTLEMLLKELPPELQEEVRDFAEFLLGKRRHREVRPLNQRWAGALSKYRDQYTSLDLQKKALDWRGN